MLLPEGDNFVVIVLLILRSIGDNFVVVLPSKRDVLLAFSIESILVEKSSFPVLKRPSFWRRQRRAGVAGGGGEGMKEERGEREEDENREEEGEGEGVPEERGERGGKGEEGEGGGEGEWRDVLAPSD